MRNLRDKWRWFRHQTRHLTWKTFVWCGVVAIPLAIFVDASVQNANTAEAMNVVATSTPQEVELIVVINWTKERIEKEIRNTFPERPEIALAIAKCESGLVADIQSGHTLSYGRERSFGIFQAHEPDWGHVATRLGLHDWRTDPAENIKLARHIYESAGNSFSPWSCYSKKMI